MFRKNRRLFFQRLSLGGLLLLFLTAEGWVNLLCRALGV